MFFELDKKKILLNYNLGVFALENHQHMGIVIAGAAYNS